MEPTSRTEPTTSSAAPRETKPRPHKGFAFFWLVPVAAVALTAYLFYQTIQAEGTIIEITFPTAMGLVPGKSELHYHGVKVGLVKTVKLSQDLSSVIVQAQLDSTANDLARSDSKFWIVHPSISLSGVSGLDTLISGNYIEIVTGNQGAPATKFTGLTHPDGRDPMSPDLYLRLVAERMPSVGVNSPILFRQMPVGQVVGLNYDVVKHQAQIDIHIFKEYAGLIRQETRFWNTSGLDVSVGLSGVKVNSGALDSILFGSISMGIPDALQTTSPPAPEGTEFQLFDSVEQMIAHEAEAINKTDIGVGVVLTLKMDQSQGIVPQTTELKYRGLEVGKVVNVQLAPDLNGVQVKVLLAPKFQSLAKSNSRIVLVWPQIQLKNVSTIQVPPDLVQGPYLRIEPGDGASCTDFAVTDTEDATFHPMEGLQIVLKAARVGKLIPGSPVYYRGVRVGQVESSGLASDGRAVRLRVVIGDDYASLVRANTKFWNCSGIATSLSLLGGMQVKSESVTSVLEGGVAFATPDNAQMGARASAGSTFDLADQSEDAWLKWQPNIPLNQ
jgi:paraquat-inducible protein B